MSRADVLHPDAILAKFETLKVWRESSADRAERLAGWTVERTSAGELFVSAELCGPDPVDALRALADRQSLYLTYQPRSGDGIRMPQMDVSQPGRVACLWQTGGVWVEVWHHDTTSASPRPAQRRGSGLPKALRLLSGPSGQLPFTRNSRKENTPA